MVADTDEASEQVVAAAVKVEYDVARLIETVQKYPCIWDESDVNYKNKEKRSAALASIARQTGLQSADDVKQKWKNVKDFYVSLRRKQQSVKSGSKAAPEPTWAHFNSMKFIDDAPVNAKTRTTMKVSLPERTQSSASASSVASTSIWSLDDPGSKNDDDDEDDKASLVNYATPSRKRISAEEALLSYLAEKKQKRQDKKGTSEVEIFGKMLATQLEKLEEETDLSYRLYAQEELTKHMNWLRTNRSGHPRSAPSHAQTPSQTMSQFATPGFASSFAAAFHTLQQSQPLFGSENTVDENDYCLTLM